MNNLLSSCTQFFLVSLDVIVIFCRTYDEHLIHLEKVLHVLQLRYLIATPTKCEIAEQTIEYLGHEITSTTFTLLPDKMKSIFLSSEPTTLAQTSCFIGTLS
ncbi:unnamed protein product [Rotaria sp. Silwood2]|nr:unnamed protein product [Rotaria sp. Silwood2]